MRKLLHSNNDVVYLPTCEGIICHLSCEGKKNCHISCEGMNCHTSSLPNYEYAGQPIVLLVRKRTGQSLYQQQCLKKCIKNDCSLHIVNYKYLISCVWLTVVYNYNILTVHNTNLPWPLIIRMCLNYVHHHHQSRFRNCFKKEMYSDCSLLTPPFIIMHNGVIIRM